jgi:hypothetical protein
MKKQSSHFFTQFHAIAAPEQKGFYPGVLVIENGIAKGHYAVKEGQRVVPFDSCNTAHKEPMQIFISNESLDDVVTCGNAVSGGVKCKLDHGSTVRDIVGFYSNFRRDGDSVRADLTLLDNSPHRSYVEEIISKMANKFGNSIDFLPRYEINGDKAVARCSKLNSVDVVDSPAATNSFFEENPEIAPHMPLSAEDLAAASNAVCAALAPQFTALRTEFSSKVDALNKRLEEGEEKKKDDDDKDEKKKEEEKEAALSAKVTTAALSELYKVIPEAKLKSLASLNAPGPEKSAWEQAVDAQMAAGAPNRGIAEIRAAKDKPTLYNAHMASMKL